MANSPSHTFVLIFAIILAAVMYFGTDASAQDLVFDNPFQNGTLVFSPSQQGECRYLGTAEANKWCVLFCEFLDCDETDYSGPDPYSKYARKTCIGLIRRYESQTGVPGQPCICDEVCAFKHRKCLSRCDPDDFCCPTRCANDFGKCNEGCCQDRSEIDYQMCFEDCGNDPDCFCFKSGCAFSPSICIPPVPVP